MTDHANELRRYARKIAHPAGDVPAVMRAAAAEIERMQAKIEAAEKEVAHIKEVEFPRKARAVAAGWETKCARLEQERDALRAKIETAENDAAHQKALAASALRVAEGWERKCGELRAKVAEMGQQEPVAWYSKRYGFVYMSRHPSQFEHGSILYLRNGTPAWRIEGSSRVALLDMASLPHGTVFYALLGAQGE